MSVVAAVTILGVSASISYLRFGGGPLYIDEITYARLGYSLMLGHLATGTSFYSLYQRFGLGTNSIQTPFGSANSVQPWLDHPPLMGFLVIPVLVTGFQPRLLPIILFNLTGLVLYLVFQGRDQRLAWATVVGFVVFGQYYLLPSMLFLDAGVSFFLVLTLALTLLYARTRSTYLLYLAGIAAALSALSKEQGVASILYLVIFSVYDAYSRRGTRGVNYLGAVLLAMGISSSWVVFGLIVEPKLFADLISVNLGRSVVSNNLLQGTVETLVARVVFQPDNISYRGIDYSLILASLGVAYLLVRRSVAFEVKIAFVSYLAVFLLLRFSAVYQTIPLYPFYALAFAALVSDIYKRAAPRVNATAGAQVKRTP